MNLKTSSLFLLGFVCAVIPSLMISQAFKSKNLEKRESIQTRSEHFETNQFHEKPLGHDKEFDPARAKNKELRPYLERFVTKKVQRAFSQKTFLERVRALMEVLNRVELEDISLIFKEMGKISNEAERMLLGRLVVVHVAQKDAAAAFEWAKNLKQGLKEGVQTEVMKFWAQQDPQAAKACLEKDFKGDKSSYGQLLRIALVDSWGGLDGKGAVQYVTTLPFRETPWMPLRWAAENWAYQDPLGAVNYALQLSKGKIKDIVLMEVMDGWIKKDPAAALRWAQGQTAQEEEGEMLSLVASRWAWKDPKSALQLIQSSLSGKERETAISTVARTWTWHDPKQAAQWFSQQPESQERQRAYQEIADSWRDSNAVKDWLTSLTPSPSRDAAITSFINNREKSLIKRDPITAVTWASTIGNDSMRFNQIQIVVKEWQNKDPNAAAAWVHNANLTEDQKNQLLSR